MILCNGDIPVLEFDLEDMYIQVLNNDFLPYALKDYIKTSDYSSPGCMKNSLLQIEVLRDYLANRSLNLSREHAKTILNVSHLPQSLKTNERLKIVFACSGLSMTDNYWIKEKNDNRTFKEVCLRKHHLKDGAYKIALLGQTISATRDILYPDLTTDGMFAKTWYRGETIELWKTDKTNGFINTKAEVQASTLLDHTNVNHVHYELFEKDGIVISKCNCLATDEVSLINGFELQDYCIHIGTTFETYVNQHFREDIAKMTVVDYLLANTDRHLGNIQFLVDNETNQILSLAPLFDFNQALIADALGTDISDILYDFTGKSMLLSAKEAYADANLEIDIDEFPLECQERFSQIQDIPLEICKS